MAANYTYGAGSTRTAQNFGEHAQAQLSDGTLVFIGDNGSGLPTVCWTDRSTVTVIATLSTGTGHFNATGSFGMELALIVDDQDNLFVVGGRNGYNNQLIFQVFAKGAGHTWTGSEVIPAALTTLNGMQVIEGVTGHWCNTGGGTNGRGHLVLHWVLTNTFWTGTATSSCTGSSQTPSGPAPPPLTPARSSPAAPRPG